MNFRRRYLGKKFGPTANIEFRRSDIILNSFWCAWKILLSPKIAEDRIEK